MTFNDFLQSFFLELNFGQVFEYELDRNKMYIFLDSLEYLLLVYKEPETSQFGLSTCTMTE